MAQVANIDNNMLTGAPRVYALNIIFSDESTFHVLQRKTQWKMWHLKKEKLLPECIQQTNTGDGGKVGISSFGTMATKIDTENMDDKLYCDVLQHQLKSSMTQMLKKKSNLFSNKTSLPLLS